MLTVFLGRLGIALLVFISGVGAYRWYWHQIAAQTTNVGLPPIDRPTIIFFSAPNCAVCHAVQAPALARLEKKLAENLQIIEVDASKQPELAQKWKIFSVPTLVILDAKGQLASIKHGVQSTTDLFKDIQPLTNA